MLFPLSYKGNAVCTCAKTPLPWIFGPFEVLPRVAGSLPNPPSPYAWEALWP
jgi:hypothetical protein